MSHKIGIEVSGPGITSADRESIADSIRSSLENLAVGDPVISSAVVTIRRPDEQQPDDVVEATILVHSNPTPFKAVGVSHSPSEALEKAIREIEYQIQTANSG